MVVLLLLLCHGCMQVLLLPTVLIVLLTTFYYEHLLTAPADSFYGRVVVRTATVRSAVSSSCAQAEAQPCYHHPLLPVRCRHHAQSFTTPAAHTGSIAAPNLADHHQRQAISPQPQHHTGPSQQQLTQQALGHLIVPQYAAVANSRSALQAYLNSPRFAAAAAALPPHSATHSLESIGSTASKRTSAGFVTSKQSSSSWQRGILVVAGGRKLLTHLVVQLKVR